VTPAELAQMMGVPLPTAWRQATTTLLAHRGMAGRIGREQLSAAFCQLMGGDLPELDAKIQPFRQDRFLPFAMHLKRSSCFFPRK
jgi:hypothetical protein